MSSPPHIATPKEFAAAFHVSRETLLRLESYASLLRQWQKTINLVAPSTLDDIWHRHFADSAQLLGLVSDILSDTKGSGPTSAMVSDQRSDTSTTTPLRWLDLGSGAGFPGLVVAIMLAETPSARVTLIESDQRKAAFLREVARQTRAPVDILSIRIEKCATQFNLPLPEVVTARALAPLDKLLHLVKPFFGPDTVGLFPKGRDAERDVEQARRHWRFACELRPSMTDDAARIAVVRNVKANSEE